MSDHVKSFCPECQDKVYESAAVEGPQQVDRRRFIRVVGAGAAGAALGGLPAALGAADETANRAERTPKPAEALVRELYASLSADQKRQLVLPWDQRDGRELPLTRRRIYNYPPGRRYIGDHYTAAQQELITRILRAISSDDDGYRRLTRNGTFENSGSLEGCGCLLFGEPAEGKKFTWVFMGHHLTVRCDGNSEDGAAFGGPIYYGHGPNGYSSRNLFYYQTRGVLSVFDSLSERQRKQVVVSGTPGEGLASVRFRPAGSVRPGVVYAELGREQRQLVKQVMRDILAPFRKEDADEVIEIIKATGGMEQIHLAFYEDPQINDGERWHFWRLEGPGFVWNYRVLPHVHTFVNVSIQDNSESFGSQPSVPGA